MEIASRVVPVLPFSICCVWAQEFCRHAGEGFTQSETKQWKREESGRKRKDWGGKNTFKMEQELSRREGSRESETMPFLLLTDRSHFIPEPGVLAQGGWLGVPCVPKLDSLGQHSVLRQLPRDNHLLLLLPFSTPCFPLAPLHTPFFFSGRHSQSSKP